LVAISTAGVAIATFVVSSRTLQANTLQQTSDRFVKAIEQLGNDKSPDVRLGGIYGLEQLARDSPSDQPAVFDVLTAFVRRQAPAGTGTCADPTQRLNLAFTSPNASPSADVLAAVDAISRRDRKHDRKDQVLDLSHTCLAVARWGALQLAGITMIGADLRGAALIYANLQADLVEANFSEAFLIGADLSGASLEGANLSWASLAEANLSAAALSSANLSGAGLTRANLSGANLVVANLSGANLSSANLSGANLGGAKLSDIYYDGSTKWPNGFQPPPSRPKP
jgi:uncharacterized protein YjbI with pentapeptide repeats